MPHILTYTSKAVKDIEKLDVVTKKRLGKALLIMAENPLAAAKKLTNPALGTYRHRVGDFRIIFDIDKEVIVVLRVGHRRDIYS
jgi:mRNA interferase RelE/StbE